MIPKQCKRLAEVDFPIAVVSKHSAREKSIRHRHPSTLHLWWARRPLGACRSMLMSFLLPDPCDPHCPADFKVKARELLGKTTGKIGATDVSLRSVLLGFIGDRLLAVVTMYGSDEGREYRLPTDPDYAGIWKAHQRLAALLNQWSRTADRGLYPIPNEEISLGTAEAKARNGATGSLEEDARLTALFLWTIQATTQDTALPSATDEDEEDVESDDEDEQDTPASKKKNKGLTLPFDVARRFAQPLGIHLDAWEGRCIATEKGIVRRIPVLDRAEQLFGEDGAEAVADRLEKHPTGPIQPTLFPLDDDPPPSPIKKRTRRGGAEVSDESLRRHRVATTLDRVHAAMLLQSAGRANALRALLKSEIERGPDFLRLANALSALYPKESDEKRLLDAMLLAVPR
jgi:hypothetical protein